MNFLRKFDRSNVLLILVCVLVVMLIAVDVFVFRSEPLMFWLTLPFLVGVSGITLGKLFQLR